MSSAAAVFVAGWVALVAAANPDLDQGVALYERADYSGALQLLIKALDGQSTQRERARIHAYIGLIQYRYSLKSDARASFVEALGYDSSIQFPDPGQASAGKLFREIKRERSESQVEPKEKKRKKKPRLRRRIGQATDGRAELDDAELAEADEELQADGASPLATAPAGGALAGGSVPPSGSRAAGPPSDVGTAVTLAAPPVSGAGSRVGGWVAVGVGTAAIAAGVIFAVLAGTNGAAALEAPVAARADELHSAAVTQRTVSIVSFGAGGVSLGVAAFLLLVE